MPYTVYKPAPPLYYRNSTPSTSYSLTGSFTIAKGYQLLLLYSPVLWDIRDINHGLT